MNYFSKNITWYRKQRGLTQDQMFQYVEISRTSWSNYEKGISEPSMDGLIRIANFFVVSVDKLLLEDAEGGKVENEVKEEELLLSFIVNEMKRLRKELEIIKKERNKKGA